MTTTNNVMKEIDRAVRTVKVLRDSAMVQLDEATELYGAESQSAAYARGLIQAYDNAVDEINFARDSIRFDSAQ